MLPTQFTNAAPFPAARAAGPAPKPATPLAGLPVAHPFHSDASVDSASDKPEAVGSSVSGNLSHSAADRLPAAETARREVDSSPTSLRHHSARGA